MSSSEATYRAWITLHESWHAANREGRQARAAFTEKLHRHPSDENGSMHSEALEVNRLEAQADRMSHEMGDQIEQAYSSKHPR